MIIELLRAVLAACLLYVGYRGVVGADWKLLRLCIGLFIVFVMTFELGQSVISASTAIDDVGLVRKVGIPAVLAGIIAIWRAPAWLSPRTE